MALRWALQLSGGALLWGEHFGVAPNVAADAPALVEGTPTSGSTSAINWTPAATGGTPTGFDVQYEAPTGSGNWVTAAGATNPTGAGVASFNVTGQTAGMQVTPRVRALRTGFSPSAWTVGAPYYVDVVVGGGGELPGGGGAGDVTPPALSAGAVTPGALTASASITSDEAGTLYWLVNTSATPLTIPAVPGAMTGWTSRAMTAGANSWSLGALAAGAGYYLHLCAQDDEATPNRRTSDLVLGPFTVAAANAAPQVTLQPGSVSVQPGATIAMTSTASGVPTPTGQWQRSNDGGSTWANISGQVADTLQLVDVQDADSGAQFRRAYSNGVGGTVYSNAATLTVSITSWQSALNIYTLLAPFDQIDNLGGFAAKDPAARVTLCFDFRRYTAAPQGATITIMRKRGADDPAPQDVKFGSFAILGSKVFQRVQGGVPQCDYLVRAEVPAPDGSIYTMEGVLPVR